MCLDTISTVERIVKILDGKKAQKVEVLRLEDITTLADYFVICTGTSSTHVKMLADEVDEKLDMGGAVTYHKEGYQSASWVLLDYGDVVVHIFHNEARAFYNLEHLWSDGERINIDNWLKEE